MLGEFGLLGVPSSAAAHGPGQEKGPAALRRARLPERLAAAGVQVVDYGDLPVVRWRPDPHQRRPHNLQAVLGVLRQAGGRVGEILADGRVPLVLGGECSVTIAMMSAFLDRGVEPALLYMDGGVDLFTPATNPTGILDSMGVAHLLDEPGTTAELAGFGPVRPLLRDDRLLLFGYTDYPGTTTWAVMAWDLFLMTTTEFSLSRLMPRNSSWDLPRMSWGRPARSGLSRSTRRSSNGKTLYLLASSRNSRCSSASFSGCSLARLWAWVQSSGPYSSHTSSSKAGSSAPKAQGVLWRVTAVQPWW
jgi:hypothetical protein